MKIPIWANFFAIDFKLDSENADSNAKRSAIQFANFQVEIFAKMCIMNLCAF